MPNALPAPNRPAPNRLVVALAYPGLCAFEFGIAAEVFGLDRPEMGPDWYRFRVCAEQPGPLATNAGLGVTVPHGLEMLAAAGTIVLPGWRSDGIPPSPALLEALRAAYHRGARLVTICSGAFLLAATGLLDGRRATTHWRYAERLATAHPAVTVDADLLYAEDGTLFTSAGSAAGIDLLLHLVRKDFGADAANSVARRMVVAAHRAGGQAQFIERPVPESPDHRFAALLDQLRADPARCWTIADMAASAILSPRTFVRRFHQATGTTPGAWLLAQRIDVARVLLETSDLAMEQVAQQAGLGTAANLRLHFGRQLGIPPVQYRRQFRRQGRRPARLTPSADRSIPAAH